MTTDENNPLKVVTLKEEFQTGISNHWGQSRDQDLRQKPSSGVKPVFLHVAFE